MLRLYAGWFRINVSTDGFLLFLPSSGVSMSLILDHSTHSLLWAVGRLVGYILQRTGLLPLRSVYVGYATDTFNSSTTARRTKHNPD